MVLSQAAEAAVAEASAEGTQLNVIVPPEVPNIDIQPGPQPGTYVGPNGSIYSNAGLNEAVAANTNEYIDVFQPMEAPPNNAAANPPPAPAAIYDAPELVMPKPIPAEAALSLPQKALYVGLAAGMTGALGSVPFWVTYGANKGLSFTDDNLQQAPSFDNFLTQIVSRSVWQQNQQWQVQSVRLAGSLLCYGKLS